MNATIKISKLAVMTRAWSIYKNNRNMFPTFSSALSRAWEVEKANVAKAIKDAEIASQTWERTYSNQSVGDLMSGMADSLINYYANNTYNGD